MIEVSEGPGQGADAAELRDDGAMILAHTQDVRVYRTPVNLPFVRAECEKVYVDVSDQPYTIGFRLRSLYERAGLSMRELARRAGFKQASSIQRYLEVDYDPPRLDYDLAVKLSGAMAGRGDPPITEAEIISMADLPPSNAQPFAFQPTDRTPAPRRDIPVYGTALGAPTNFSGLAVEQTNLDVGDTVTYFARPAGLAGKDKVYGLFAQGSSMSPRFSDGEGLLVDGQRPPMIGDDVVVYLVAPQGDGQETTAVLLKRLVRRTAEHVELEQFNPALTFKVERERVLRIHRVIPWSELIS